MLITFSTLSIGFTVSSTLELRATPAYVTAGFAHTAAHHAGAPQAPLRCELLEA